MRRLFARVSVSIGVEVQGFARLAGSAPCCTWSACLARAGSESMLSPTPCNHARCHQQQRQAMPVLPNEDISQHVSPVPLYRLCTQKWYKSVASRRHQQSLTQLLHDTLPPAMHRSLAARQGIAHSSAKSAHQGLGFRTWSQGFRSKVQPAHESSPQAQCLGCVLCVTW